MGNKNTLTARKVSGVKTLRFWFPTFALKIEEIAIPLATSFMARIVVMQDRPGRNYLKKIFFCCCFVLSMYEYLFLQMRHH